MRFYPRRKIAEITNVSEAAHNFSRDVKDTLAKWGYGYDWINRRGVTITYIPATPEERLKEILIRQFHVDVQVDMYTFACFVTAFNDIDGFECMPWAERVPLFRYYSGKHVDQRTLSNWCRSLIEHGIVVKGSKGSYWKTEIVGNRKIRTPVDEKEVRDYNKRRSELLLEIAEDAKACNPKITDYEAQRLAWGAVYPFLWAEFGCCYYSCKTFYFTAWTEQGDLAEVYELTREISGKEVGHAKL